MIFNDYLLYWWDHSLIGIRVCYWTISRQYQILPKYSPIFRILMTNNSKTKTRIATLNVPIPIPIELLEFLLKKGQHIVPNNIVDQYAHVWPIHSRMSILPIHSRMSMWAYTLANVYIAYTYANVYVSLYIRECL